MDGDRLQGWPQQFLPSLGTYIFACEFVVPSNKKRNLFSLPLESGLTLWLVPIIKMWQRWHWALSVSSCLLDVLWLLFQKTHAGFLDDEQPHGERIPVIPVAQPITTDAPNMGPSSGEPVNPLVSHYPRSPPPHLPTDCSQLRPAEELLSWAWPKLQNPE